MNQSAEHTCPACESPLHVLASVRIEYHLRGGNTIADEIETDALRCMSRSCRYACIDLTDLVATATSVRCSGSIALNNIPASLPRPTSVQIAA
jgi:hypothetical protein